MKRYYFIGLMIVLFFNSCINNKQDFDASGMFEAEEIIISAQNTGIVEQLNVEEGQYIESGQRIGFIDSMQLYLKKKQLKMQIEAVLSKIPNVKVQIGALNEQLKALQKEQVRVQNLVKSDAATKKQLDDMDAQIAVLKKQIDAQQTSLSDNTVSINKETMSLEVQVEQIDDQLKKCKIINPVEGTVILQYTKAKEMVSIGKPLYKIADLSNLYLRAYFTGSQLSQIKLNQKVFVKTDNGSKEYKSYSGEIIWISEKAEFTPKTVQTKEERSNLVYAVKIKVKNDGLLKIGMYGEVKLKS